MIFAISSCLHYSPALVVPTYLACAGPTSICTIKSGASLKRKMARRSCFRSRWRLWAFCANDANKPRHRGCSPAWEERDAWSSQSGDGDECWTGWNCCSCLLQSRRRQIGVMASTGARADHALMFANTIIELRRELRSLGGDPDQFRVPNLRFHDLRRTLGSWQARTGVSLAIIGKSLHHKSPASTAVYARLDMDPVRDAMARAATAMWRAGGLSGRPSPGLEG